MAAVVPLSRFLGGRGGGRRALWTGAAAATTEDDDGGAADVRARVLREAMLLVPQTGFTLETLQTAAVRAGLPEVTHGLVRGGAVGLIEHHVRTCTAKTAEAMQTEAFQQLRTTDKIRQALRFRLTLQRPVVQHWPDALALLAQPPQVPLALELLGTLADEIWYQAGDRSVDINWYTKRGLLASVYASSELYMTQDRSPEFLHTFDFVDRRLRDVEQFGKLSAGAASTATFVARTVHGLVFPARK